MDLRGGLVIMKYDFGFGTTPGIAEIFLKNCPSLYNFKISFNNMQYPPHNGIGELVKEVDKFLKNNFASYKHILITNGATHSLSAALNAYRKADFSLTHCLTQPLYYRFYPQTIEDAGLKHKNSVLVKNSDLKTAIYLIASPSNPTGEMSYNTIERNVIFDSVYFSKTYCKNVHYMPAHEVLVGGINKLSGLTGVRIGWLATNSDLLYDLAHKNLEGNTCCVSLPSQLIALEMLKKANWDKFYTQSYRLLQNNKEVLGLLSHLFGNQKMPENGMFAYYEVDQKLLDLFAKSNVTFTLGNLMGGSSLAVRINLAKTTKETVEMVSSILRNDKI